MANGTNTAPNFLWKIFFKINTARKGFNIAFHMAETPEATARAAAIDLSARMLAIMPSTAAIFFAAMSKDDPAKDSRIIPEAQGVGLYLQNGVSPAATPQDSSNTCINIRFENNNGGGVTRQYLPIPDTIITNDTVVLPITPVVGRPGALPAAPVAQPVTYATEFNKLMQAIVFNFHHVQTRGHVPGGNYTYYPFQNAYVLGVSAKKGGRVFTR